MEKEVTRPAIQLLQKMEEDKVFAEKIFQQTEMDDVLRIAKEKGFSLTVEDVIEVNALLNSFLKKNNDFGELSEDDLELVAGGFAFEALTLTTAVVTIVTATAVGTLISASALITLTVNNAIND